MDGMIYVAMGGAAASFNAQAIHANNLANVNTVGFKADLANFVSSNVQTEDELFKTLVYASTSQVSTNFTPGTLISTGRELDIAISGEGFIGVLDDKGQEAYTRNGNFHFDQNGLLLTSNNLKVMGSGGEITIPPANKVIIGNDGTISYIPLGEANDRTVQLDKIKFVKIDDKPLVKSSDGLFRTQDRKPLEINDTVTCAAGYLESSNVNAVQSITEMINLARQFEINMKLIETAGEQGSQIANILAVR